MDMGKTRQNSHPFKTRTAKSTQRSTQSCAGRAPRHGFYIFLVRRNFWWPGLQNFIRQYIKGCATCQQNKADHQRKKLPLLPITLVKNMAPFTTTGMNWIMKLPPSGNYDAILTIMDHDCSKAVIFIPCTERMGTEDLAKLYFHYVFPFFGLPSKIILD